MGDAKAPFAGLKQRLARGAAGVQALFTDEGVREKTGALLRRNLSTAVERGQTSLRGVLAKVQEADALRALRRRAADEDPPLVDLQVGARVYEDVPKYMRTQLWLSLLDQQEATARSGAAAAASADVLDDLDSLLCEGDYYEALVSGFRSTSTAGPDDFVEDVGAVISRDISRTFPTHTLFQTKEGRGKLQRVLHAYAIHDPPVGYCQGMAFVAGMLLMYLEEGRAFAALVTLMHGASLRALYLPGMAALQLRLRQLGELLRRRSPALAAHLDAHDVSPVIYASSWFLSLFAAEFPFAFTARILDVALAERSSAVVLRAALGLLDAAESALLELHNFEALVIYLKVELKNWPHERLREILTLAVGMEGVNDVTLAALADDIARDDAEAEAAAAARAAARAAGPASGGAAADAAELLASSPPAAGHIRTRSSTVLEMLLDMDLGARVSTTAAAQQEPQSAAASAVGAGGLEDWVTVSPPMSGGTLGVLATGGVLLPPVEHADGPMSRPSLRMLQQPLPGAAGGAAAAAVSQAAAGAPPALAGSIGDLIELNSPVKRGTQQGGQAHT